MNTLTKVAAYARFSSDLQREESIDAQLAAIRDYAARNGYVVVREFVDRAKSATTDQRPAFQEMIQAAEAGEFQGIIIHKLDRFSRSKYDSAVYKRRLRLCNVSLFSVTERLDDSAEALILESVLEAMAEYYSRNLAREVLKGLRENAKHGRSTGGIPPFGFRLNKETKLLELEPDEAAGVQAAFQMLTEGYSYHDVADELNRRGLKTRGGKRFGVNSLYSFFRNEKYRGCYIFNRSAAKSVDGKRNGHKCKPDDEILKVEGACPRIVSDEVFYAVQKLMDRRQRPRGNSNYKESYLLTGRVYCGNCGCTYVGSRRKRGDGSYWVYYGCNARMRHKGSTCKSKEVSRNYLESLVLQNLSSTVFSNERVAEITTAYNEYLADMRKTNYANSELGKSKRRLDKLTHDLEALTDLIIESKSKTLIAKMNDMETEKQDLETKIRKLELYQPVSGVTEDEMRTIFERIREKIMDGGLNILKQLIDVYVDRITVYENEVVITYNFLPQVNLPMIDEPAQRRLKILKAKENHPQNADDFGGEGALPPTCTISLDFVYSF